MDAKVNRLLNIYDPIRQTAQERIHQGRPKADEKPVEQIPQDNPEDRKTRTVRARTAKTNPKYIDLADKLVEKRPDLMEQVERGEKVLLKRKNVGQMWDNFAYTKNKGSAIIGQTLAIFGSGGGT